MTTPTPTTAEHEAEEPLWCLHVLGPDEVHPAPDRATAQLWAAQFTVWWQRTNPKPDRFDPIMSWIVAEWPHDAERHAAGLERSIASNTFPVDPLSSHAADKAALEARVAELPQRINAMKVAGPSRHLDPYDRGYNAAITDAAGEARTLLTKEPRHAK